MSKLIGSEGLSIGNVFNEENIAKQTHESSKIYTLTSDYSFKHFESNGSGMIIVVSISSASG